MAKSELERRQAVNKATANVIPVILIGIVGYATWVVIVLVAAHYLIHPDSYYGPSRRLGAGIAIIVLYFVFLIPPAICYFRLLASVREPGYIPTGTPTESTIVQGKEQHPHQVNHSCTTTQVDKKPTSERSSSGPHSQSVTTLDLEAIFKGELPPPPGLEGYYSKEVFACDPNGLPVWCGTCSNWKPDRSHHCSDVGRCVMKLDHFCPWVGGVVAEKNFKFFIQFNTYTCLYTLFILITMAYFVHDRSANGLGLDVNWIIVLALSALFTLFTAGMAGTSIHLALNNLTTIDDIDHSQRTMYLAVYLDDPSIYSQPKPSSPDNDLQSSRSIPRSNADTRPMTNTSSRSVHSRSHSSSHSRSHSRRRSSSLDRPGFAPGECMQLMFKGTSPPKKRRVRRRHGRRPITPPHPWIGNITYPLYTISTSSLHNNNHRPPPPPRTFAILRTHPGMNPWDLGAYRNWKTVMGNQWYDWLVPLRYSPCCNHDRGDSLYELGPDVDMLKADAGLVNGRREGTGTGATALNGTGIELNHEPGTHSDKRHKGGESRLELEEEEEEEDEEEQDHDEDDDSVASSTMANVDGFTGRQPVPAGRSSSSSFAQHHARS